MDQENVGFNIAGGLKIKVIWNTEWHFGTKLGGLIIKGGLKIKGCKVQGLLYMYITVELQTSWHSQGQNGLLNAGEVLILKHNRYV